MARSVRCGHPLAEWAETFLGLCRRLSPRTQETYRRDLTTYIVPRFGSYRIGRMPAEEIERRLRDEIDGGLTPSSVHRHYRRMRRMFQVAVEKQKIVANPCGRVHPPSVPKTEMTFPTWDQAIELAEAHPERFRAMIYLAVDSGMRWGELVGLQRKAWTSPTAEFELSISWCAPPTGSSIERSRRPRRRFVRSPFRR